MDPQRRLETRVVGAGLPLADPPLISSLRSVGTQSTHKRHCGLCAALPCECLAVSCCSCCRFFFLIDFFLGGSGSVIFTLEVNFKRAFNDETTFTW